MKKGFDFQTREERLRIQLGVLGYTLFTLRGWFGKGFVALDLQLQRQHALIFRKKGDDFEIQALDSINHVREEQVINLRFKSKLMLGVLQTPYNPTRRKFNYHWQWLVLVKEQRGHVLLGNGRELSKEEVRKVVGAPIDMRREPAPKRISVMPKREHWRDRKPKHGTWR